MLVLHKVDKYENYRVIIAVEDEDKMKEEKKKKLGHKGSVLRNLSAMILHAFSHEMLF